MSSDMIQAPEEVELQERRPHTTVPRLGARAEDLVRVVSAQTVDATIPDGGYGWVVISACFVVGFWSLGVSYGWGVLQKELVQQNVASTSILSFVGGLTTTCVSIFAILNARLVAYIGSRWTGLLGVAFAGIGQILVSFKPKNIASLFICVGVITGIGISLSFITISVTPAQYFLRKRGLANGIVYAGGGLGGTILALLYGRLLQTVGLAWTFRIVGLMTLATGLPAAYFIKDRRPANRHVKLIDWTLFSDPKFVYMFISGIIATFPLFVPPFFIPLYAGSVGLPASTGAALLAGFNLASAVGRVGFGLVCDSLGAIHALLISLFLSAISMLAIWPVSQEIGPLTVFVIVGGLANGGFFSTIPTAVGSVFGTSKVTVAMGMIATGWGGGYLMGGPIAGYLLAAFGGEEAGFQAYRPAMYYSGAMSMLAAALLLMLRLRIGRRLKMKI